MRGEVINGIAVNYPDKLCFAFNPCLCTVTGVGGGQVAWTETECGDSTVKIQAYHYMASWDIRELMQLAISDKDVAGTTNWTVAYTIRAYAQDGTLLAEKEADVIFGGRLAQYKYYDMAPVIESVMELSAALLHE